MVVLNLGLRKLNFLFALRNPRCKKGQPRELENNHNGLRLYFCECWKERFSKLSYMFLEEWELNFWSSKGRFFGIIKQRLEDHLEQGLQGKENYSCMFFSCLIDCILLGSNAWNSLMFYAIFRMFLGFCPKTAWRSWVCR